MTIKTTAAGWIARILCVAAILFVSMFSLDAFETGNTLIQKLSAFGMHLIPSFVLIILLIIAWRHELTGGIIFMLIGIGLMPFIFKLNYNRTQSVSVGLEVISMINLPFVIVGALFIFSFLRIKKRQTH